MTVQSKRRNAAAGAIFSHAFQAGMQAAQAIDVSDLVEAPAEPQVDMLAAVGALGAYYEANELKRKGTRDGNKARKVIDSLSEGVYGVWKLVWSPNPDREELDMEAIEALYGKLGIPVPYKAKPIAPSLKVEKA